VIPKLTFTLGSMYDLRSPSIGAASGCSAATLICDSSDEFATRASGFAAPIEVPHFLQNRAPGLTDALQDRHLSSSRTPQFSQKEASGGLSLLHFAQVIRLHAHFGEQCPCILQIVEPSVNQLSDLLPPSRHRLNDGPM
jgi:hypothetical protein